MIGAGSRPVFENPLRWLRQFRARRLLHRISEADALTAHLASTVEMEAWQLARLNDEWTRLARQVAWYRDQIAAKRLPKQFDSLAEFQATVPVTTRDQLRSELTERTDATRPGDVTRATGGSTAEPIRFPCWSSEADVAGVAAWQARSWLGITPADRLFLLWGHSHLFGVGFRGAIRRVERQLRDALLGYCRWSAYDLSPPRLREAGTRLCRFRPGYVIGYSTALDRFAEANAERAAEFHALRLKAVIATAEAFPAVDSRERIARVFGCPVLMEYGAVESGLLAQEVAPRQYRTLWQHTLLESRDDPENPGRRELIVTSLYPRCLPLVRYRIGDHVESADPGPSLLTLREVLGRCNDVIQLHNGRLIHSEAIAHIVRDFPVIRGYQLVQRPDEALALRLRTTTPLPPELQQALRDRLGRLDQALATATLTWTEAFESSVAGKIRTVVRVQRT